MSEKVIVVRGIYDINQKDVKEVNEHLSSGWTIKSMEMVATKEHVTAIFVLKKD
ncbi:MAG: hypothetical protein IKL42_00320 [Clostridia bacterium]|nr:hypothetical protein [Clostridia bacterium]MBR3575830.1 hypothetical protein [Clostridia bacterium]